MVLLIGITEDVRDEGIGKVCFFSDASDKY